MVSINFRIRTVLPTVYFRLYIAEICLSFSAAAYSFEMPNPVDLE